MPVNELEKKEKFLYWTYFCTQSFQADNLKSLAEIKNCKDRLYLRQKIY